MRYTATIKHYSMVTKASPEHLRLLNGQPSDNQPSPVDGVGSTMANKQADNNPFLRMVGIGIRRRPTEEIMRETRGEDSMR